MPKANTALLQNLLGMAIDVTEGDYGGCTRQVKLLDPPHLVSCSAPSSKGCAMTSPAAPFHWDRTAHGLVDAPVLSVAVAQTVCFYLFLLVQITIDDKGLAAIFVFGVPGSPSQGSLTVRCLRAAMEVTRAMNNAGIKCCAGLEFGSCFCGLVGDPAQRCEYAVLGGARWRCCCCCCSPPSPPLSCITPAAL